MKEYTITLNFSDQMPRGSFSKILGYATGSLTEIRATIIEYWYEMYPDEFIIDKMNEIHDNKGNLIYKPGSNIIGTNEKYITFV